MSCSSSDEGEETFLFYKCRPEWNDVIPLPQDDGPNPVVAISYSDKFKDVYDYFRAVLKANEMSERSLQLTEDAIKLNSANYTVWEFRRQILKHLNKDLNEELLFTSNSIKYNPKNYQVWHHRLLIVEKLNTPGDELEFISSMLQEDSKNYHAWHYRQWLLRTFNLFEGEMAFVDKLLNEDLRNNSAWNQRHFVITHTTGFTAQVIQSEIDYTIQAILKVKKNESAWNYLRGVVHHSAEGLLEPKVMGFVEELYKRGGRSPHLFAYLVDAHALKMTLDPAVREESKNRALQLCKELSEKHDVIRKHYWNYVAKHNIEEIYDQLLTKETVNIEP